MIISSQKSTFTNQAPQSLASQYQHIMQLHLMQFRCRTVLTAFHSEEKNKAKMQSVSFITKYTDFIKLKILIENPLITEGSHRPLIINRINKRCPKDVRITSKSLKRIHYVVEFSIIVLNNSIRPFRKPF